MTSLSPNMQSSNLPEAPEVDISGLKATPIDTILNEEISPPVDTGNNGSSATQEIEQSPPVISREEKIERNTLITKLRRYFSASSFKDLLIEYIPLTRLEEISTPDLQELLENVQLVVRSRGDNRLTLSTLSIGLQGIEQASIKMGYNIHGLSRSMIEDREIHILAEELSIEYSNYFPGHPFAKLCLIGLMKAQNLHTLNTSILHVSRKLDKDVPEQTLEEKFKDI